MCVLEDKDVSLMDMNTKYLGVVTFFEEASQNIDNFMSGNMFLFDEHDQRYCMLAILLPPHEYDDKVHSYLEMILATLCQL